MQIYFTHSVRTSINWILHNHLLRAVFDCVPLATGSLLQQVGQPDLWHQDQGRRQVRPRPHQTPQRPLLKRQEGVRRSHQRGGQHWVHLQVDSEDLPEYLLPSRFKTKKAATVIENIKQSHIYFIFQFAHFPRCDTLLRIWDCLLALHWKVLN